MLLITQFRYMVSEINGRYIECLLSSYKSHNFKAGQWEKQDKLLTILLKIPMSNRVFCLWQFGWVEEINEKQMKSKMGFPKYTTTKNSSMIKFWNLSFESKECSLFIEVSLIKRLNMKIEDLCKDKYHIQTLQLFWTCWFDQTWSWGWSPTSP